jgi:predicted O-methyltransferase YrrM
MIRERRPENLGAAFEFVARFEYGGIRINPIQVTNELRDFLQFVAVEPPANVLEIGTARGGTLFMLSYVAKRDAILIGLDTPFAEGTFGGDPRHCRRARVVEALGGPGQQVVFLKADSHRTDTVMRVSRILGRRPLDLLFIDGDHTLSGVAADFEMYSPLVRSGGFVALHDIVPGPEEAVGGVPDFWQRIKQEDSLEFVEDWNQGGYGIGLLRV